MKALKASICVAVTALTLSLSLGAPSCAGEDEAITLTQQMKELYRAGKYKEALPLAQKSLDLREKEFGPDDANVAMPLNDLGTIHYNLGQYPVAELLYKRSPAIREKTLGPDHAGSRSGAEQSGRTSTERKSATRKRSRFSNGRSPFAIKCPIADDPSIVMALSNLAAVYSNQGQYDRAEPLFKRGLAILEKAHGPPMILKPQC